METNKEVKISFWASHVTSIVSVSLVLLLVGIIALVWGGATSETRRLREQVEINLVLGDSVSDARAKELAAEIKSKPYAANVKVVTREAALQRWTQDTGEDLRELYGVNPLSPEIRFSLRNDYCSASNVGVIEHNLQRIPEVAAVDAPDGKMVERMNSNLSGFTGILAVVAGAMMLISFVLINNTVQLTIHSRRFTIHTMRLVGATKGFISRPIVANYLYCGLISGCIAALILAGALYAAPYAGFGNILSIYDWRLLLGIGGGLLLLGIILCSMSAWLATARYLRKSYDELFR